MEEMLGEFHIRQQPAAAAAQIANILPDSRAIDFNYSEERRTTKCHSIRSWLTLLFTSPSLPLGSLSLYLFLGGAAVSAVLVALKDHVVRDDGSACMCLPAQSRKLLYSRGIGNQTQTRRAGHRWGNFGYILFSPLPFGSRSNRALYLYDLATLVWKIVVYPPLYV